MPPSFMFTSNLWEWTTVSHHQDKKLSCRTDRATLPVIEYFAKSLMVIQNDTLEGRTQVPVSIPLELRLYLVPFLRSASNN